MILGALLGLAIIVGLIAASIWILRQPVHRYQGDPTPARRRSFRETMTVWLMGPR
jgi:hypothetical protein